MLQLLYNGSIQHVAVAVFHVADMAPAALLHGAEIGINELPLCVSPLGQLWTHVLAAVAADQQPGEQGHIAAGLAVAFGFVPFQNRLYLDPRLPLNDSLVLAHRHDPLLHGLDLVGSTRLLQGTVIGHNAMDTIKVALLCKEVYMIFRQVVIGKFIGNQINRIGQNPLNGKAGKLLAVLCGIAILQQVSLRLCQRAGFQELVVDQLDNADLLREDLQLAGLFGLAVNGHMGDALRSIAGGGVAAQPAPCFRQLMHIVPDALGNGLPLQLGENRGNIHHRPSHGGGGIKLLLDGDEVNLHSVQLLDQLGKIADVTADPVEAVDNYGPEVLFFCVGHHSFELRPLQRAAREAFILIYQGLLCGIVSELQADILPAHFNLVFDALSLAGKFGFSGVDYDWTNSGHKITVL